MQAPIISRLLESEPDLADLVKQFVQGLPDSIAQIRNAVDANDWAGARQKLHDLKGMGGNFGFPELTNLAKQMEAELIAQHYQQLPSLLLELDSLYARIELGNRI